MYSNRFVLFLDILGFKEIVGHTLDEDDNIQKAQIERIIRALKMMKEILEEKKMSETTQITQFSDTIIVSFEEKNHDEIRHIFHATQTLIMVLVKMGFLTRGAISYGQIYHDQDLIFGPALIHAYLTESKAALYPRVILDRSLLDILSGSAGAGYDEFKKLKFESDITAPLSSDEDGQYYFDYIEGSLTKNWFDYTGDTQVNYMNNLRDIIISGLDSKKPDVLIKYGWLRTKFNSFLDYLPEIICIHELHDQGSHRIKNEVQKIR